MKISEIRKWKLEDGWYINPKNGNRVKLGDGDYGRIRRKNGGNENDEAKR